MRRITSTALLGQTPQKQTIGVSSGKGSIQEKWRCFDVSMAAKGVVILLIPNSCLMTTIIVPIVFVRMLR